MAKSKRKKEKVEEFMEIGGSPVPGITLRRILRGHTDWIGRVAWSPDGKILASGSFDRTVRIWDIKSRRQLLSFAKHTQPVLCLLWSTDQRLLVSGSQDGTIRIWDLDKRALATTYTHRDAVLSLSWIQDEKIIVSGSWDRTIKIWDLEKKKGIHSKAIHSLEGHADHVNSIDFSFNDNLLASKAEDNTVRVWWCNTWKTIAVIPEISSENWLSGLAFHPKAYTLATLGERDTIIRIWDLDLDMLLGPSTSLRTGLQSVRYTTAKLVLVGDSGVGKTGLGWRMAHNEFKEHSSSHGQQFWVIGDLCTTRADGTECEAVLWDLAGQHVYRPIHAIFFEDVDMSLVLFDPTNRQEPLKGVEFWLEQLAGKQDLPPSVLVGARVDRGAPVLSQQELEQFCQRHKISGGYISTSAKEGDGLKELIQLLKAHIPWDQMTATVTTVTFKRIKEYVLSLKEQPDRTNVLVSPEELHQQLQSTDPKWEFSDAEMMTAVKHLETHGYVAILRSSSGEESILLTPELLVDLASSTVLQASKHPRDLGALSETDLLQGHYEFSELDGLDEEECEILLDAAVLRFLEHNICFRETLGNETLLIFPGLIKQKRPLLDDVETIDDVSYIVRGAVENIYAALVVLLGYTRAFTRINQWQNQAQYEMGQGEICGFRQIEEREGEIELILYYGTTTPSYARTMFQGLFDKFLYQRDVQVTIFPPVYCPQKHLQERATVVKRLREGKTFLFCEECGEKIILPDVEQPMFLGVRDNRRVRHEEALAHLRSRYETYLARVKSFRRDRTAPRCYISHVPEQTSWVAELIHDLRDAGVHVLEKRTQVAAEDFVIVVGTLHYQQAYDSLTEPIVKDISLINERLPQSDSKCPTVVPLLVIGDQNMSLPRPFHDCQIGDFRDDTQYAASLFDLVLTLYAIPFNHPAFAPLRKTLQEQWERMLADTDEQTSEELVAVQDETEDVRQPSEQPTRRFDVALSFPGEYRDFVKTVAEKLAEYLGQDRVFYDEYYTAELARPDMDTYLQAIYHDQADLIVVFLCAEYERKEWCGLEWRAVRDLLKHKQSAAIMPVRFDDTHIPGLFSIDGYVDASDRDAAEVANLIMQRLNLNRRSVQ